MIGDDSANTPEIDTATEVEGEGPGTGEGPQPKRARLGKATKVASGLADASTSALRFVVKVYVQKVEPNYALPWQMRPQKGSHGSGFVLDAKRRLIITNSHVIMSHTTIHVRKPGNPKKWKARLLCESRHSDLALLSVEEEAFWSSYDHHAEGVRFDEVPHLQQSIMVCGYPMGGDQLCVTKGIVSRITMSRYSSASINLLSIQIDAAINPGNSGGPAFTDLSTGMVGGVAFSKVVGGDNVGYIISKCVVDHFMWEYETHGFFRGMPAPGFRIQMTENEHLRGYLGLEEDKSGVTVAELEPLSEAAKTLQKYDVILEVDGEPIADDGTITFRGDERVDFGHLIFSKHIGDVLRLKVWRNREARDVEYAMRPVSMLIPMMHGIDCAPQYFVIAGCVFVPLSKPYIEHFFGSRRRGAPPKFNAMMSDFKDDPDLQVVVLSQILASDITFGYHRSINNAWVLEFNGIKIKNLQHLVELVDDCTDDYLHFLTDNKLSVILNREAAQAGSAQILKENAIAYDRSEDLRQLKETQEAAAAKESGAAAGEEPGSDANGVEAMVSH